MGSKVKKLLGAAAPIIGNLIAPGIGGVIGGAAGGALSGGGLKGALMGGLQGAATGFGPQIGGFANKALGIGLQAGGTGESILGGALGGAATGALRGGGLRGALMGGATGGAQSYLGNGGFGEIGNSLGITGENSLLGSAGETLYQGFGPNAATRNVGGSGVLGAVSNLGGGGGSTYSGNSGGSSYSNLAGSLLGGVNDLNANDNAESDLLKAQRKALSRYQPYVDAKFEPGDLTQDPGYQFRLQQGEQAINRSLGARGKMFSGEALKAAEDYGQGLADTTYNEAYNRWLRQNDQNIGVADRTSDLDTQGGSVRAAAGIGRGNIMNRTLADLLRGYGAYSYA